MTDVNSSSCSSCKNCSSCSSCSSCKNSSYCDYCHYCSSCKNLKMTEYNYFCWSENYGDENSFQQKRYRVFNVEITKEEYTKLPKLIHRLDLDEDESDETRFQTAFKKLWASLTETEKQKYYDIPHFNWEGFTFITGVEKEARDLEEEARLETISTELLIPQYDI